MVSRFGIGRGGVAGRRPLEAEMRREEGAEKRALRDARRDADAQPCTGAAISLPKLAYINRVS
jgi:hypothetical protein